MLKFLKKTYRHFVYSRYFLPLSVIAFAVILGSSIAYRYYFKPIVYIDIAVIIFVFLFGLFVALYLRGSSRKLQNEVSETRASLHETEKTYQTIVEQSTDLIYILDTEMRVLLSNPQAIEVFSRLVRLSSEGGIIDNGQDLSDPETYIGHPLNKLFRSEDWEFVRYKMKKVLRRNDAVEYEHSVKTIRGNMVRLSTRLTPVRSDDGEITSFLGVSRDITEKSEFQQRMYGAEKLASIGTLAAGVAHEINNPLAIIHGFADLLLEKFEPGSIVYDDLKIIELNCNNAKKVVENLLGFSRMYEVKQDYFDLKDSINTVITILRHTLNSSDMQLETYIPDQIPPLAGDAREYQQVLLNLINNSIFATKGESGRIKVNVEQFPNHVLLSISDNGDGIPKSLQNRIFDPFFSTKPEGEGTGLGLWLCYGIINKYNGSIDFNSVSKEDFPDRKSGTTFTVTIPFYTFEEQNDS